MKKKNSTPKRELLVESLQFPKDVCMGALRVTLTGNKEAWVENYLEFVYELQSTGVKLSIGSDCHSARLSGKSYEAVEKLLTKNNIQTENLFSL